MIFCANVSILFKEVPLLEWFGLAAAAGFSAVEFWWPGHEAEPGTVERAALEGLGYDGYVGLEYNPTTETTEESLK